MERTGGGWRFANARVLGVRGRLGDLRPVGTPDFLDALVRGEVPAEAAHLHLLDGDRGFERAGRKIPA